MISILITLVRPMNDGLLHEECLPGLHVPGGDHDAALALHIVHPPGEAAREVRPVVDGAVGGAAVPDLVTGRTLQLCRA